MRKWIIGAVSAVLLLVAGAGIAYASIPGPDGTIHGCYKTSDLGAGALYVIDSGDSCPSGFTSLNWSQSASPVIVTKDVTYSPPGALFTDIQTVDCTSGLHALNGGIVQTTAGTDWQTAIGGGATGNAGQAITQEGAEIDDTGGGAPNTTDPVNLSLPRAVNSGGSWKMKISGVLPVANGTNYSMTVTLYAVCI